MRFCSMLLERYPHRALQYPVETMVSKGTDDKKLNASGLIFERLMLMLSDW